MRLLIAATALLVMSYPSMGFGIGESISIEKVCPELERYFEESSDWDDFDFEEAWKAGQCFGYLGATMEMIYIQNPNHICADYRILQDGSRQRILTGELVTVVLRYLKDNPPEEDERAQSALLRALEANYACDAK